MSERQSLSVIVPVAERYDDLDKLFTEYRDALAATGMRLQFIYVLDGKFAHLAEELRGIDAAPHALEIIRLSRTFGESAALTAGIERADHDLILTLPAYYQVDPESIGELITSLGDADLVIAKRSPRRDSLFNRVANRAFHAILRFMTDVPFSDIGCGARLIRRRVLDEVRIYGDQHRFLPILADRRGYRVREVALPQSPVDTGTRIYRPSVYLGRLLDIMSVFFLARFTKKPLRFFGMVGSVLVAVGVAILVVAVLQRYLQSLPLADRPVLLLGSLLLVLGVQLFSLGLIGELIIFTHAGDLKEYAVAETVNMAGSGKRSDERDTPADPEMKDELRTAPD